MNSGVKAQEAEFDHITAFKCGGLDVAKGIAQSEALESLRSWPIKSTFELPCGNTISTDEAIEHLEKDFADLPCPCGDPSHALIAVNYKDKK